MTLGHVVLCIDDLDEGTLEHELVHVGQWERWGIVFPLAYLASTLSALFRGAHFYRDNSFEGQARNLSGPLTGLEGSGRRRRSSPRSFK